MEARRPSDLAVRSSARPVRRARTDSATRAPCRSPCSACTRRQAARPRGEVRSSRDRRPDQVRAATYTPPQLARPAPPDYPDAPVARLLDASDPGAELFAVLVAIGGEIPLHYHPVMELQFVLSGTGLALDADGGETPIGTWRCGPQSGRCGGRARVPQHGVPAAHSCFASIPLPAVSPQAVRPSRRPADRAAWPISRRRAAHAPRPGRANRDPR